MVDGATPAAAAANTSCWAARRRLILRSCVVRSLRSLLGYWHNHPRALLSVQRIVRRPHFAGPGIDEARNDSVYELELAFKANSGRWVSPPRLGGRSAVSQSAIDATGNNASLRVLHRQDVFSPDGNTGRLGLLEMRAFEMPTARAH